MSFDERIETILDIYFNQGGNVKSCHQLVKHQINSYNDFIENKLEKILTGYNPIVVKNDFDENIKDYRQKIYLYMEDPHFTKPIYKKQDGTQINMTPNMARYDNLTYSADLYINIRIITECYNNDNTVETKNKKLNDIYIGKLPVMVGSKACILTIIPDEHINNECKYDMGGYFIVNGNEKVLISQDRIKENYVLIFKPANNTENIHAEIRSTNDSAYLPAKTISLTVNTKSNHMGRVIRINTSFLKYEIPVFIMFRALGILNDFDIISHIIYDINSENHKDILQQLKACCDDASGIYTREDAIDCILRNITGNSRNIKTHNIVENILKNDFLPNISNFNKKALYLGYMIKKILNIYLGYDKYDNRDSYMNKRIDSPGILMSSLFRQSYGKITKELKLMIERDIGLWRANNNKIFDLINDRTHITKYFKQSLLDSWLKYALSTGNWGIKSIGSFQNIKQGVSQVLNRMSYLSTLSHLRRVNTAMEKNGKLVQPRKLDISQFGMICPCETPEGAPVGLVKNLGMSTNISSYGCNLFIKELLIKNNVIEYNQDITNYSEYLKNFAHPYNCFIIINGEIFGYHTNPIELFKILKQYKRQSIISPITSISLNLFSRILQISTEAGRMYRPLFIVDENNELRLNKFIKKYGLNDIKKWTFEMCISPYTGNKEELEGFIEYLDIDELTHSMVAMYPTDLLKEQEHNILAPQYTYCEIHPSLMFGVLGANIPFANHNQAPRNTYQCLYENELVLMADGTKKKIKNIQIGDQVLTFDPITMITSNTKVINQYVKSTDKNIVEVTTISGRKIITTDDHKYWTNQGWISPQNFNENTKVSILINPNEISSEIENNIILDENMFTIKCKEMNIKDSLIEKHKKYCLKYNILPIRSNSKNISILAKMFGYILTDGSANIYNKKNGGMTPQIQICFGSYNDALNFENDVKILKFKDVKINEAYRIHSTNKTKHHTFDISHNGPFASLIISLGITCGKRSENYHNKLPDWITNGSLLTQREFCSGFQGGDGCKIRYNKLNKKGFNIICAKTSNQINPKYLESLQFVFNQIVTMFRKFNIEINDVQTKNISENRIEVSYKILDKKDNLIKYFDTIGYGYCEHKFKDSAIVIEYLKYNKVISNNKIEKIKKLIENSVSNKDIIQTMDITESKLYDIKRSIKMNRKIGSPNIKLDFDNWKKIIEIKENCIFLPITVKSKENCMIADITVENENHCFFGGDSFGVHNSAMGKQALGVYMSNFNDRMDTISNILNYPQKALIHTKLSKYTHTSELPAGINAVVAIMTYSGFNQEDGIIVNKDAVDRGLFVSTHYKTLKEQCNKNQSTGEEEFFCLPDENERNKQYNYSKLDKNGFVPKNTYVENNDIIVGKIMPKKIKGKIHNIDTSVSIKPNEQGIVDLNYDEVNNEGYCFCKMRIRNHRIPAVGDKLASSIAQKASIGMIYNQEDMPYTKEGIVPDLIMNPHAIPSRMTIAQLMECVLGKVACYEGKTQDCTPYNQCTVEEICNKLESYGMQKYSNEILYDGYTGKQIKTEIFIGPTYYQRLKHMVVDKIHSRGSNGPIVLLTRQPSEGRSRSGGLRLGEMERDAILAHGTSLFLKERLLECSDNSKQIICKTCGTIIIANSDQNLYTCSYCRNETSPSQIRIPYSFKLLSQELQSMSIAVRFCI